MKYQCIRCENVIDIPKKMAHDTARKTHACQVCNDMTTFEKLDYDLTDLTDAQRDFLRSIHQEVRVTKKSKSQKHLHISHNGDTLCNHGIETRKVDVSTYPLGYLDWCEHCLARSKHSKEDVEEGSKTTKQAVKKAIQLANERVDGDITTKEYTQMNITPSMWTIKKKYGTWSQAKEDAL